MKKINMKKLIILLISVCFGYTVKAQQLPQIAQYMINNYAVNPAIAGMEDHYQVKTTIRNMWGGIEGAPQTTILSIYGKKSENMGLGGIVYSDKAGATSRIGGNVSYTHHFALSTSIKMSMGLSAGFLQYRLAKNQLTVLDPDDPFFQGGDVVRSIPDATFGLNAYAKNWYIGLSIPQLIGNNLDLLDGNFYANWDKESEGKLLRHYYILGAYEHVLNPFWSIEPSLLMKSVSTSNQFDIGIKATWDDKLWFGTGYRTSGEISALAGYSIQDRYIIGYSYDMHSDLGASHEFVLGIRFIPLKQEEVLQE